MNGAFGVDAAAVVPAVLVGLAAALAVAAIVRPAPRLRPYNSANRVRLGRPADLDDPAAASPPGGSDRAGHRRPARRQLAAGCTNDAVEGGSENAETEPEVASPEPEATQEPTEPSGNCSSCTKCTRAGGCGP